jgi:hypothetical protein
LESHYFFSQNDDNVQFDPGYIKAEQFIIEHLETSPTIFLLGIAMNPYIPR